MELKSKLSATNLWKECIIIFTLFIVARSKLINTAAKFTESFTKNTTCEFKILKPETVKQMFDQFVRVEKADLVFFNIEVDEEFLKNTTYDNKHENGVLRWIWVPKPKTDILSYPVDLDGITLQLTKSAERTIRVLVNASAYIPEHNTANYSICVQSLYQSLFNHILDQNTTDWKFCHRYFEGQYWKYVIYFILGSWVGYDFECFSTFCLNIDCASIVSKGTVNIVIIIFIFLMCANLPLFYLFLPKRQHISADHSMHYYKGDSPYSFVRLFLHLNKNINTEDSLNGDNEAKSKSFFEWIDILRKDSRILEPEAKVLPVFYFVLLGVFLLQELYLRRAIADFDKYTDIYHPYYLSIETVIDDKLEYKVLSLLPFTGSFVIILPVLLVYMSYYGQSENKFVSLNPIGIHNFDKIVKQKDSSNKYTGYTKFAMKFLTRIAFFFRMKLWIQTFSMPFFLRKCSTLVQILICPLFLTFTFPLNVILYIFTLLFPMFHFVVDCFLFCPFKYMVHCRPDCSIGSLCMHIFIFVLQYVILISYFMFAFRTYLLFTTQFVFKLIVYSIFVAGPLFSTSETSYQFWAISLAALVYILKYTVTFNSNYKYLLKKLLKLKQNVEENRSETTGNSNIDDLEDINCCRQSFSLANKKKISIHVELFEQIASEFMPLRIQLLILFLKLFFTGIFLYVTFDSISKGGNAGFLTTQIPLIITVVMPGIAERLVSSSNIEDDIQTNEEDMKLMIINYEPSTLNVNSCDNQVYEHSSCVSPTVVHSFSKHFALIFPIFYTVKCILISIFFCYENKADEIDIEGCPDGINCCQADTDSED